MNQMVQESKKFSVSSGLTALSLSLEIGKKEIENPNAINTVYNIAYGSQISINQLIDLMAVAIKKNNSDSKKINVIYSEKRPGEIVNSYASIEKAKELLGYVPEVSLREGLERYLSQLKINEAMIK